MTCAVMGVKEGEGAQAQKESEVGLMLCCHHLEVLNNFEQGASYFHFSLGPTYYIADSEAWLEGCPKEMSRGMAGR